MTKVKICGITNLIDAQAVLRFGADEIGFNFYPGSPRYIDPSEAAKIVDSLGNGIRYVGVFVNESLRRIVELSKTVKLDAIQLHGDETRDLISSLKLESDVQIIKACRVGEEFDLESITQYGDVTILLDAFSKRARGGTGETFDWATAAAVNPLVNRLYLAGGLTPLNVTSAIAAVRPYAVDTASGVESEAGKKDADLLEAFIKNAKNA